MVATSVEGSPWTAKTYPGLTGWQAAELTLRELGILPVTDSPQKPTATPTQKPTATLTQKPTATPTQEPTTFPHYRQRRDIELKLMKKEKARRMSRMETILKVSLVDSPEITSSLL